MVLNKKLLLILISLVLMTMKSYGLDVSFIPNSENEPLPLSTKYRDSLRKLCALLHTEGAVLPAELLEKKAVLEKVCHKLKKDDENIDGSLSGTNKFSKVKQNILYGLIGLGSGYFLWSNRGWLTSKLKKVGNSPERNILGRGGATPTSEVNSVNEPKAADISTPSASAASSIQVSMQGDAAGADKIAEARAARLKRFSEMNAVNEIK